MKHPAKFLTLSIFAVFLGSQSLAVGTPGPSDGSKERTNAMNFHMVDFIGWNNRDFDVLRHYHTNDVKVRMAGMWTYNVDDHMNVLKSVFDAQPDSVIIKHSPTVVEGDWNCTVGISGPASFATIAKFRRGAISEEYILTKRLESAPTLNGQPIVRISNKLPSLKKEVGAELGWSCVFGKNQEGKFVAILTKGEGGSQTDQLFFEE